jgi:chaperone required for assembly of F1-ATPase
MRSMTKGVRNGGNRPEKRSAAGLPKRFYKAVAVARAGPATGSAHDENRPYRILLDGKPVRTPAKRELALPTRALAEAIAAEWEAQGGRIDPATMPLTRLANSAIDGVAPRQAQVRADIAKYAGSDLVCYRAEQPAQLVARQAAAWDPILAWAREALGAPLIVATGIMPVAQPRTAVAAIEASLEQYDPFVLAAMHVMTTLMGSALLAIAHANGRISAEAAWAAAHVDEDFQISQWGEDSEAKARRERRWAEMVAASRLLALL